MPDHSDSHIKIIDAYENNLKHISVAIPKNKLVIFAGVSGSGKSSLVFDTIAVESARQWQNSYPLYLRNKMPKYERPKMERIDNLTPSIVVDQKMMGVTSRSTVGTAIDVSPLLRLLFSRVGQPSAGGAMAYSFNHPLGMCPDCTGLGERMELIEERMFDPDKTLNGGAIQFSQFQSGWQSILYQNNPYLNADKRLSEFSDGEWKILKYGTDERLKIEIRSPNTGRIDFVCYEGWFRGSGACTLGVILRSSRRSYRMKYSPSFARVLAQPATARGSIRGRWRQKLTVTIWSSSWICPWRT